MKEAIEDLELPAQASELYLAASWSKARGDFRLAGRRYLEAARLWKDAAEALQGYSPSDAIRQFINHVVTLFESGNIPHAQLVQSTVDQSIAQARMSEDIRAAFHEEWRSIVEQRIEGLIARWDEDKKALLAEVGDMKALDRVSADTAQRWMERYPCYPGAHYMGYLVADREHRLTEARQYLDDALLFDPENPKLAGMVLTNLVKSDERTPLSLTQATRSYDRFRDRSARVCYLYAMFLIWYTEHLEALSTDLLERAAVASDLAVKMSSSDLTIHEWGWANIFLQYCNWRLKRPGVSRPEGRKSFWWGSDQLVLDVPSLGDDTTSATMLVSAASA